MSIQAYCRICKVFTIHSYTRSTTIERVCLICEDKDRKDMEESMERIRIAEGMGYTLEGEQAELFGEDE